MVAGIFLDVDFMMIISCGFVACRFIGYKFAPINGHATFIFSQHWIIVKSIAKISL